MGIKQLVVVQSILIISRCGLRQVFVPTPDRVAGDRRTNDYDYQEGYFDNSGYLFLPALGLRSGEVVLQGLFQRLTAIGILCGVGLVLGPAVMTFPKGALLASQFDEVDSTTVSSRLADPSCITSSADIVTLPLRHTTRIRHRIGFTPVMTLF